MIVLELSTLELATAEVVVEELVTSDEALRELETTRLTSTDDTVLAVTTDVIVLIIVPRSKKMVPKI